MSPSHSENSFVVEKRDPKNMNRLKILLPRLWLVAAGILIGLGARYILGAPDESLAPKRQIDRPISTEPTESEDLDGPTPAVDLPLLILED